MRQFILYFNFFLPLFSIGQVKIYNKSLLDTTKPQLYQTLRNHLIVQAPPGTGPIQLKADNSSIHSIQNNEFELYCNKTGKEKIKIYSKGKLLSAFYFRVDTLSFPIVRLGNRIDTVLTKREIRLNPFLNVIFQGTNYKGDWFVLNYKVTITSKDEGLELTINGVSHFLTPDLIKIIERLQAGDELLFTDIVGGGPDSRMVKFSSLRVQIK